MQEGAHITVKINNKIKSGKIIKIYTQVGMKNHGETFAVVIIDSVGGLFGGSEVRLNIKNINLL